MRWPTCSWPAERPTDEGPPAGGRDGSEMPVAPGRADGPGVESTSGPATSTDEEGTRPRVKRELIQAVLHDLLLGGGFRHQRVAGRGDVPAVPRRPLQRGPGLARVLRRLPAGQPGRLRPGPSGAGAGLRRPRPPRPGPRGPAPPPPRPPPPPPPPRPPPPRRPTPRRPRPRAADHRAEHAVLRRGRHRRTGLGHPGRPRGRPGLAGSRVPR